MLVSFPVDVEVGPVSVLAFAMEIKSSIVHDRIALSTIYSTDHSSQAVGKVLRFQDVGYCSARTRRLIETSMSGERWWVNTHP